MLLEILRALEEWIIKEKAGTFEGIKCK